MQGPSVFSRQFWSEKNTNQKLIAAFAICCFLGLFCLVGLVAFVFYDLPENHGLTFGYWGGMNRVKYALEDMPGIEIIDTWIYEEPLELEKYCFTVRVDGQDTVSLYFFHTDIGFFNRGERLKTLLQEMVSNELAELEAKNRKQE